MKIFLRLGYLTGKYGELENPPLFLQLAIPKNRMNLIVLKDVKEIQEIEYVILVFERKEITNDVAYYDYVFVKEEKEVKK